MNDTLKTPMLEATRLTLAGRLSEATQIIQRALSEASTGGDAASPVHRTVHADRDKDACMVIDGCVFEIDAPTPPEPQPRPEPFAPTSAPTPTHGVGEFVSGSFTQGALTRAYKLYVPPHAEGRSLPLVVMLHGCTQNPDDFAAGTGMNERAREQGFFVLYPAQSQEANPSRCWNWFKHNHQQRGRGEPALIAGMTQAVIKQHGIDVRRVYVAGLSAGGAMAAVVAEAYPELFAAVGVHSGLPRGAANGLPEALAVMKEGGPGNAQASSARAAILRPAALPPRPLQASVVPTIVFHGDQDQTVHPHNGERVVAALLGGAAEPVSNNESGRARVEQGLSPQGRRYTRSVHVGGDGATLAEHWLVHGAGHAWSGGHAEGSYTDARGPDATGEMLRFFFERPHRAAH